MFYKIKQTLHKINLIPRNIKIGVINLITWFPIIWKDRQWDYYFIYNILRHKLHLTEQFIRHYGCHVKNIQDADKIKKCVLLLDRLIKDEYHDNVFRNHDKKWGDIDLIFMESKEYPEEYSEVKINYPNVKTEEDKKLEKKEFKRLSNKPQELINQDLELLFKIMRKNIQTWWD